MAFETSKDVLDWYEKQDRTLTDEFIGGLPWHTVKDTPLDKKFIPVLLYMRDVEVLTDMYHRELQRTPTGRDPVIAKFMERWGLEEITHGQVINRFLNEGFDGIRRRFIPRRDQFDDRDRLATATADGNPIRLPRVNVFVGFGSRCPFDFRRRLENSDATR